MKINAKWYSIYIKGKSTKIIFQLSRFMLQKEESLNFVKKNTSIAKSHIEIHTQIVRELKTWHLSIN